MGVFCFPIFGWGRRPVVREWSARPRKGASAIRRMGGLAAAAAARAIPASVIGVMAVIGTIARGHDRLLLKMLALEARRRRRANILSIRPALPFPGKGTSGSREGNLLRARRPAIGNPFPLKQ